MPQPIEKLDANFAPRLFEAGTQWIDIRELGVQGRAFSDTESFYDRFPARARPLVNARVWELSCQSAGMCVRFTTDASVVSARWTLRSDSLAMPHMPATGVSGLDLYLRDQKIWRWLGLGRPSQFPLNEAPLTRMMEPRPREMLLYLPLYNGVTEVLLGIPEAAIIKPAVPPQRPKPLCFYGTSIVQGGCASRPGMAYPAIVSRKLEYPHYNFGFSGNGKSEPEIAHLLADLDPAAYILDPLPNMNAELVSQRMEAFVRILHAAHPHIPILLVENIRYQDAHQVHAQRDTVAANNRALQQACSNLRATGVNTLRLVPGDVLLGDDGEATVDGVHPTDLGFTRMAAVIGSYVVAALELAPANPPA